MNATSRNRMFFHYVKIFDSWTKQKTITFYKMAFFFIEIGFSYYLVSSEICDEHIIFLKISFIITWINRTFVQCWSWWSPDQITSSAWWRKFLAILLIFVVIKVIAQRIDLTQNLASRCTCNIYSIVHQITFVNAVAFGKFLEKEKRVLSKKNITLDKFINFGRLSQSLGHLNS